MDQSPRRPLTAYVLCSACLELLEAERAIAGEVGCCSRWCPHTNTHGLWNFGQLTTQPCSSSAEHDEIDARIAAGIHQALSKAHDMKRLLLQAAMKGRPPGKPS
jgi:hypothetical protein